MFLDDTFRLKERGGGENAVEGSDTDGKDVLLCR